MNRNEILQAILDDKQLQDAVYVGHTRKEVVYVDIMHNAALLLLAKNGGTLLRIKPEPPPDAIFRGVYKLSNAGAMQWHPAVRSTDPANVLLRFDSDGLQEVAQCGKPSPRAMEELLRVFCAGDIVNWGRRIQEVLNNVTK